MDDVTPTGTPPRAEPEPASPPVPRSRRKRLLGGLTLLCVLCGAAYAAYWAFAGRFVETTDDAYVAGNVVALTPQVNGTVVAIRVDNTQWVKEGQVVVLLDATDAQIALEQAEARLAQTVRQVQGLYQTAAQQEANVTLQRARLAQSTIDYRRDRNLVARKFVSAEDYQHRGTQVDIDQASLDLAEHQRATTEVAVANTELANHPQVRLAAAALRAAYVAVQRTRVRVPVTGYVDKRAVQIGQRVSPGTPLMAIIPLDQIWVDANFKESQLRTVRIGQPVKLTSDLYGGRVDYRGRVLGLGAGTGSAFAVLPPQNATGNWIKVVQRIPVRVGLAAEEIAQHPLRIGLSMEAKVDTRDRSGASLSDDPEPADLYVTSVYNDEDKGADELIARIIKDNTVTVLPTQGAGSRPVAEAAPAAGNPDRYARDPAAAQTTAGPPVRGQIDAGP